jgi:hypothetical protein
MCPHRAPIAQKKNNLSIVLTKMYISFPGGLEVSTADQYSQDLKFKTNPLHYYIKVIFSVQNVSVLIYTIYA